MDSYKLKYPVEVEGQEPLTELTFHRLRTKDMRALRQANDDFERGLVTLSRIAQVPLELIDELDVDDLNAALDAMADFLPETASAPNTSTDGDPSSPTSPQS